MDTWERLKYGFAGAGVIVLLFAVRSIADLAFPEGYAARPGYRIADVSEPAVDLVALQRSWPAGLGETGGRAQLRDYMSNIEKVSVPRSVEAAAPAAAPPPEVDLGTRLAAADLPKGRQTAQVCTSCHNFDQGGPDRIGPNLWGVVGRKVASRSTFTYSSAFAAQTGEWTYDRLDHYLTNPAKAVPGNKMGFAGIRNAQDRADVIAFLSTLSASRVPFPKAQSASGAGAAHLGEQASADAKDASANGQQKARAPAG